MVPYNKWEPYLMSRLKDIGALKSDAQPFTYMEPIPEPELHKLDDIMALYDMVNDIEGQKAYIASVRRRDRVESKRVLVEVKMN
jgi:hypothetical protein